MAMLDFLNVASIFWIILVASATHVLEEYFGGFVEMFQKYSPIRGMTKGVFLVVNSAFIILCALAAVINVLVPIYSLSIAALIFINSFIHVGGAIKARGYAAGIISAILLYIPLSVYAYLLYSEAGLLGMSVLVSSFALGASWMGLALCLALAIGRRARRH
jgi:hypothetical protein